MANQMVFQRYELKYLMSKRQRDCILKAMEPYMAMDQYGHSGIHNLYLDTPDYRMIRTSMERPIYKEKLRLRSYGIADTNTPSFLEIKKKYDSVVYKRRIQLPYGAAAASLADWTQLPESQIGREIQQVMTYYPNLEPRVFLSYEREAFFDKTGGVFRVTFDENIRYRREELRLDMEAWGESLLPQDRVLMELKTADCVPLWMARALSEQGIYKTSFSKYGAAYEDILKREEKGVYRYA